MAGTVGVPTILYMRSIAASDTEHLLLLSHSGSNHDRCCSFAVVYPHAGTTYQAYAVTTQAKQYTEGADTVCYIIVLAKHNLLMRLPVRKQSLSVGSSLYPTVHRYTEDRNGGGIGLFWYCYSATHSPYNATGNLNVNLW
jgi:hypothetical protein